MLAGVDLRLFVRRAARWRAAGVSSAEVAPPGVVWVRAADLGGSPLGLAAKTTTWLDDDAAGRGWSVHSVRPASWGFGRTVDRGVRGGIDLLSVVIHEFGNLDVGVR